MVRIEYTSEQERSVIIDDQNADGLILVVEENIREGNFLTFDTEPNVDPPTTEERLKAVEDALLSML